MVFGIGEGKIDLLPEKRDFAYGEKINGKLVLDLKKPKKARKLRVKVYATITSRSSNLSSGRSQTKTITAYEFEQELSGEKEYPATKQEYSFELPLPSQPVTPKGLEGPMGDVLKGVALLSGASQTIKWYLDASLDMSGFDINKKISIVVG